MALDAPIRRVCTDMLKFTLDTNCLIDVDDEDRPAGQFVRQLCDAASEGKIDVAMVASSASERQQNDEFLGNMTFFKERMERLGFDHLQLLPPLLRYGIGFWDHGLWVNDESEEALETLIYAAMFPTSPKEWADYAAAKNADPKDTTSKAYFRWRNQILDAQAFWAHEHHGRDVFVTSDKRFKCLMGRPDFPDAIIEEPHEAVSRI
ncbi:MAG: hypothetical protein NUV50_04355 [Rhodospirillales bacterium]|nr:hypothetical protein [Rhodospirillales bacterium]